MTSKRNPIEPQSCSNNSSNQIGAANWLQRTINPLGIGAKIGCGYAFTLSIAIVGTAIGIAIGDHYEQRASAYEEDAIEEVRLLSRLQISILAARTHQEQFVYLLERPELLQRENAHFLEAAAELEQVWSEFKSSEGATIGNPEIEETPDELEAVEGFLRLYRNFPETYLRQTKELIEQIDPLNLQTEDIEAAQNLLLSFDDTAFVIGFDGFSSSLAELSEIAYEEYEEAEDALLAAAALRTRIIVTSMLLSAMVTTLFAIYTSQAIARPLKAVTQVAQQVTQDSNFDLQAPIMTTDEVGVLATSLNQLIQRVKHLMEEQKAEAARQLIQSEKMSSLGRMIAGVAHEINNPVNFIYGNLDCASDYIDDLLALLRAYETAVPNPPQAVQVKAEEVELEFLEEDLPKLLRSMQVGADRVRQIVTSLKNFSRLDETDIHSVDLHACIDSTLLILNSQIKKGITIVKNYGNIPAIEGYAGPLYQVFMNLLSNAIDALMSHFAIGKEQELAHSPRIVITTERLDGDRVVVRIADNGSGIAPEHQAKIFDTFFTTKPRGIGTGLGLSISYQIVVEKHGGSLTFSSEVGKGTEFAIALPIKQDSSPKSAAQISALVASSC